MEQGHAPGDHRVEVRIVGGGGVRRSGRRTCLSCNSALLRMSASASRVAIMQLRMAEASILTSRCGPVHTEGGGLFASRQEREGRQCELMCVCVCVCVSSVCSADYGLRCGALRCVVLQCVAVGEQQPLIEDAPNKNLWRAEKAGRCRAGPQRGSGNQLQYRSRGLPIRDTDSTVEAECRTRGSFSSLSVCFAMYCCLRNYYSLVFRFVSRPHINTSAIHTRLAARLASTSTEHRRATQGSRPGTAEKAARSLGSPKNSHSSPSDSSNAWDSAILCRSASLVYSCWSRALRVCVFVCVFFFFLVSPSPSPPTDSTK